MFFGREAQIEQLESLWRKRVGSLVTCRGRRRIGKSTLIEQFAQKTGSRFIKIEGVKPKRDFSNANELEAFAMQLSAQTGADPTPPSNWLNAFIRLNDKIRDGERTVVLLDEISWLGASCACRGSAFGCGDCLGSEYGTGRAGVGRALSAGRSGIRRL